MLRVLNAVGILALVVLWGVLAVHWEDIPDRVPTHFNVAGEANAWGSKAALFALPVVGTFLFVLLSIIPRLNVRYNVPNGIDPERPEVRREVRGLLTVVKTILAVSFAYIQVSALMTAMGMKSGLGPWLVPVLLGSLGATVLVAIKRMLRFRRVE